MPAPSMFELVQGLVKEYNAAKKNGDIPVAVEKGKKAVELSQGELKRNPNGINSKHFREVIEKITPFLQNPSAALPKKEKPVGGKGGSDPDDKISETDWFSADVPKLKLKDIAGLQNVKDEFIVNIFAPTTPGYCDIYRKYRGDESGLQVLLYGPPGTGKTHAVKCLAGELGCKIAVVKVSDTNQKYVGEGAKVIETVFDQAAKYDKCIIFFDEIDSIASSREDDDSRHTKEQLTTLLTRMDGFTSGVKAGQIRIVIAATNRPWALDSAVKRGGRFDTQIYIPLPDIDARRQIVRLALGKDKSVKDRVDVPCDSDVTVDSLALRFEGYSGADIKAVCRQAVSLPLKREIHALAREGKRIDDCVRMSDFDVVLDKYINSITDDELMKFDAYKENMEYDMDYIRWKLDQIIKNLYNKISIPPYEKTWFKTYYDAGMVRELFGKKYDLGFLSEHFK